MKNKYWFLFHCSKWLEEQKKKQENEDYCSGCVNVKGCVTCVNGNQRETKG